MNILKEIKSDILNTNINITEILRKFKVLASDIKNNDLMEWVDNELSGYKSKDKLPDYRIKRNCIYQGKYISGNYQLIKFIPEYTIPKELLDNVKDIKNIKKISEIEYIVKQEGDFNFSWTGDYCEYFNKANNNKDKNIYLYSAYFDIKPFYINIIDEIKNKLLDSILKIENELGYLPDTESLIKKESVLLINNIFNGCIFKDSNVSVNSEDLNQEIKK